MFGLKTQKDGFRLLFPKNFLCEPVEEKYTKILKQKHGYFLTPIDFINETVQKVQVLGFANAVVQQNQTAKGIQPLLDQSKQKQAEFAYPASEFSYRSATSPIALTDRTLNVEFRHTLGYLNYFILFENFWYQYARDMNYKDMMQTLYVDILDEIGSIYSRIVLYYPFINSMDMLDFDYTQPISSSSTFKIEFKYSNFDFEFIEIKEDSYKFDDEVHPNS